MRIRDWSSDVCPSDLAREGADIAIVYLENRADAVETAAIVEAEGRRAIAIKADVAKPKAGEKIVEQTTQKLGRLDILVNNAGEQHPAADIRDLDEDQLQRTFATNTLRTAHRR